MKTRVALVAVFSIFISLFMVKAAEAATLYVTLDKDKVTIGDQVNVSIKIDSEDVGINAAQATLDFSNDILEAISVDKSGSVFNFWLEEPSYSNDTGQVSFVGGSINGLTGRSLHVARVTFRVKGTGKAELVFSDGAVTASDGSGTNVLSALRGAEITSSPTTGVAPPLPGAPTAPTPPEEVEVTPPPPVVEIQPEQIVRPPVIARKLPSAPEIKIMLFPDPEKWYNFSDKFFATWELPEDVSDVADEINQQLKFNPSKSEGLFDNKSYQINQDGVWYLHVRFKNNIGWGPTATYRIAVDRTPPVAFDIQVKEGETTDFPNPTITYETGDELSGIAGYSIRVDNGDLVNTTETSYTLPLQKPGQHLVRVFARDLADNTTEKNIDLEILPIGAPTFTSVTKPVFLGEGNLGVGGTAPPESTVILTLKQKSGDFVAEKRVKTDANGNWETEFDQPLKKGSYFVEAISEDSRGAQSLPVVSDQIKVKERPLLVVAGLEITKTIFFVVIILALLGAFAAGFASYRLWRKQIGFRVILAARDVTAAFNLLRKDVDKCLVNYLDKVIDAREAQEMEFLLKKIRGNIDKTQKYIVENIEEIRD